ncbi:MAG: hypothetical protein MOGMAGMI_02479 [Candidatus Omnitrophica bacterium]|nr:hypothetical protein [Candidatus Omnitrophota bacterium]
MADALYSNDLFVTFDTDSTRYRLVMDSTVEEQLAVNFMTARATGDEVTTRAPNGLAEDVAVSGTILTNTTGWQDLDGKKGTALADGAFLIGKEAGVTDTIYFQGAVRVDFPTVRRPTNGPMEIDFIAYLTALPTIPSLTQLAVA